MKKLLLILAVGFILSTSFAQQTTDPSRRFDLRVNAGTTFTFVPDFSNRVLVARDGLVVPGLIHPSNSVNPLFTEVASSSSESRVGWNVAAEVFYNLPRNFALSFGAGLEKMRFDYASTLRFRMGVNYPASGSMDNLNQGFGKTDLLYLSITPFAISKQVLNKKLSLQAGPVLNWLLKEKSANTVLIYDTQQALESNRPDQAYFDTIGNTRDMIWGANLSASYKVLGPVSISVSAQYYFNSLYEDKAYNLEVEKVNPLVLHAGVSVAPFAF